MGLTSEGGSDDHGTLYIYNLVTEKFSVLHNFGSGGDPCKNPKGSLEDGADGYLYGTTESGGISENGCVFRVTYDGSGFELLYEFKGPTTDGSEPLDNVLLVNGTIYGMTKEGGKYKNFPQTSYDCGTIFALPPQ